MVFYYKDMEIPNKISDWLVIILFLSIIILTFLIYKKHNSALYISIILAIFQVYAIYKNCIKYPL